MDLRTTRMDVCHENDFAFEIQDRINSIIKRPLNPDTIDVYADTALNDLIVVVESVLDAYRGQQGGLARTQREEEWLALADAGLHPDSVEHTLDHIQVIVEQLRSIDHLIDQPTDHVGVIVPPGERYPCIVVGAGNFKEKQVVPRTKTVLFVVAQEYGLDILDETQVCVHPPGDITESMMRDHSYRLLEFPSIERAVLVCDEVGNVTYVFDTAELGQNSISLEDVTSLSKDDINFILDELPDVGRRIKYTQDSYVNRVIAAFKDVVREDNTEVRSYLEPRAKVEPAPEGWLSRRRIANNLGTSFKVVKEVIGDLENTLRPVMVRFGSRVALAYSPEDQERILLGLIERGVLVNPAPEGWLSIGGVADKYKVDIGTVKRAFDALSDEIQPIEAKFTSVLALAYSPEDQEKVRQYLDQRGAFADEAPEGWLSCRGIADSLGLGHATVGRAITALEVDLCPVQAKFGPRTALAYPPEDQEKIYLHLQAKGIFTAAPPEGWLSARGMADRLRIGNKTVERAILELGNKLQPVQAKYMSNSTQAYSPEDQGLIYQHLDSKGTFSSEAPQGWLGVSEIANIIGVDAQTVRNAIDDLGGALCPTTARFGTRVANAYSPDDQQAIISLLRKNPRLKMQS